MAGGRIDIEVNADTSGVAGQLQRGLGGAVGVAGNFGKLMGAGILAGGVVSAFGEVITAGNDFTNELNTMQAVSSATAEQMAIVSDRAKQLGNDAALPNTSASDAAAAMTELAKGGFSVQQAMDGAKGTLQLAAAAQIDAATAATIQSQALQSFGLDASYAATAADVLANAANASSAEITDISAGLAQSGAVANNFGLTIEDTAATLGVLSNAGIAGSDAGTLLKSALLALTDQGKPAQAAIEELGLTVYNAEGQFVGMSSLFGQLDEAAASMTPELYQAATATLFGSDAMRLAGVAAEQGQAGYDAMHTAVERQGAAAEVAAAKTQGLPGAMASIGNATETLALELYDLIKGPLEGFATGFADFVSDTTPKVINGLTGMASAAAPVASGVGSLVSTVAGLPTPLLAGAAAFAALRIASSRFGTQIAAVQNATTGTARGIQAIATATGRTASAGAAGNVAMGRFGSAIQQLGTNVPAVARMQTAFLQGATGAERFGRTVGAARAAASGMSSAAGGVASALGGPMMVGLIAATVAVTALFSAQKTAARQHDLLTQSTTNTAIAQRDMAKAFQESKGAVSDNVLASLTKQFDEFRVAQQQTADAAPGIARSFMLGFKDIGGVFTGDGLSGSDQFREEEEASARAGRIAAAFDSIGLSNTELAGKLAGSQSEFDALTASLRATGEGGEEAAAQIAQWRDSVTRAQEVARNTTPGFYDLQAAVKILSDESASATDRIDAMRNALDVLSGKPIPLSDALQAYNQQVRDTAAATKETWDQTLGWGDALIGQNGAVDTASANGDRLRTILTGIKDETIGAAVAGADMGPIWAQNEQQMQQLSIATGVSVDALRRMAEQEGLVQRNIEILASLKGADTTEQQLVILGGLLQGINQPVDIPVEALTDEAKRRIVEVGGTIDTDINGKPGIARITAPTDEALRQIREIGANVQGIPDKRVTVTVDYKEVGRLAGQFGSFSPEAMRAAGFNPTADYIAQYGKAEGGPITGGVPGKDSVPILAMPGEHMLTTDDVNRLGGQEGVYRFREALARGEVKGYAGGGAIVDSLTSYVGQKFPALQLTSGYRDGDSGYHGRGMAADFSNGFGNTDAQLGLATLMASKFGSELKELIYDDPRFGREVKDGQFVDDSFYDGAGDHTNHVHIATDHVLVDPGEATEVAPLSERDQIADAIIAEGRRRGITANGIKAAVMTGLAESDLQNLDYGDRDSIGVFQQRDNGAWGTAEDRMDPTRAAGMFYDKLVTFDYDSMDPADAAQKVQQSAFADGSNYRERAGEAEAIISGLAGRAQSDSAFSSSTSSSSKKVTWAEKDQIALERAQVAVTQAEESRDETYANEKKSQADREQADLKVKQAKQKVIDLQAKKDAAAAGAVAGPAPQAPDLAKNFTDEEISRMRAQLAVDQANAKRNEVYADPEATDNDRTEADLALASARNALAEEQEKEATGGKSGSGGSEGFSVKERLKDFGAQVTGILVDALFEQMPFGIGDSRWWDLKVPAFGAAAEEAKGNGGSKELVPVGAAGWVEGLFGPTAGGLRNLVENGSYDQRLTAIGLTEDNPMVVSALGTRSLFTGNFDQNTRSTFGVEEDHPAVTTFLENKELAERPWEQKLAEMLESQRKTPMVLRDTGGRLPHGTAALNLSGQDEWVTTAAQRDQQIRDVAAMRTNNTGGGVATLDTTRLEARIDEMANAARQPTVVFQTDSVNQGIRAWRSEVNVQSMSFKKKRR